MQLIDMIKITNLSQLFIGSDINSGMAAIKKTATLDLIPNSNIDELIYIPNTTLLGSLRQALNIYKNSQDSKDMSKVEALEHELFGVVARYKGETAKIGRIKILHAYPDINKQYLESIERFRISYKTASFQTNIPQTEAIVVAQKHEFYTFLMIKTSGLRDDQMEHTLEYLSNIYYCFNNGLAQLGGYKSIGLGQISIDLLKRIKIENINLFLNNELNNTIKDNELTKNSILPNSLKSLYPSLLWALSCPDALNKLLQGDFVRILE